MQGGDELVPLALHDSPEAAASELARRDLSPSFGEAVDKLSKHIAANPKAYPADPSRTSVFEDDEASSLDTATSGSLRHQSTALSVSRALLRTHRAEAAALRLVLHARDIRRVMTSVISDVRRAGGGLVSFTDSVRYDETPLKLTVVGDSRMAEFPDGFAATTDTVAEVAELRKIVDMKCKDATPTKLLQTQRVFGVLVSLGSEFFFITLIAIVPVLSMERTTSTNYFRCHDILDKLYPVGDLAAQFGRAQRLGCT